ncbi:hypothetical protein BDV35DRAFT_398649 [Aspergillus flavus]|uniref:Uncharacterized protein n=1 Tax=Aspergillus flavus TaxID=5059 RepID=A0A364LVS6_ASPFL|nr:hypothetical protein BDV35DRAFT_398649 [Aspergillus flavus]RAQ61183.1 hypothetical protein COH21_011751 [Aspergillus flavus]RAQ63018.1 hypothetical protein COH20_012765 [Aspergillus flavus]RMZ42547.1 hypothetical protein CA14_003112 [Aspergillus flavus]UDD62274.1 hypothetical protein AFCA_009599 [Aspergillus flavus]
MDFLSRQKGLCLKRLHAPKALLSNVGLCNDYLTVLRRGESLAQYLGERLFINYMEERLNNLLNSPDHPISIHDSEGRTKHVRWAYLLRHLEPDQFEEEGGGVYRYSVWGHTVKLPEYTHQMIRCGILQQFLEPWPILEDVQKELDTTDQTFAAALHWYDELSQARERFGTLLHELRKRRDILRSVLRVTAVDKPSKSFLAAAELSNAKSHEMQPLPDDSEGNKLLDTNVNRRGERQNSLSCQSQLPQDLAERILNESPRAKQLYSLEQQGTASSHQLAEENNFFSNQLKSQKANPSNVHRCYMPGFKSYSGKIPRQKRKNKVR